jgi:4-amino-4-deoxy-L-arabinose transferase-like glycosyltransferase
MHEGMNTLICEIEVATGTRAHATAPRSTRGISELVCLLCVALVLRLFVPSLAYLINRNTGIFYSQDTPTYIEPACQLIAHLRFTNNSGQPELVRTPGYPLLMIPGLLLHKVELVTISLQGLIGCLTVYIVYCTGMLLFNSKRMAVLAGFLYALEPVSLLYVGVLLTETLFTCIVMICVYYLAKYAKYHRLSDLITCGIAVAASAYVRPITYFLPGIITLFLVAHGLTDLRKHRLSSLAHAAIFLAIAAGALGIWQVRNRIETGYSGFSGISAINMYFYSSAAVIAAHQHVPWVTVQHELGFNDESLYLRLHPEQKTWTPAKRFEYMSRQGRRVLMSDPITFGWTHFQGIVRTILQPGAMGLLTLFHMCPQAVRGPTELVADNGIVKAIGVMLRTEPLVFWSYAALVAIELQYIVFAAAGLISSRLTRDPTGQALVLVATYLLALSGGPYGTDRFREPIMPILCIFAAQGVRQLGLFFVMDRHQQPMAQSLAIT